MISLLLCVVLVEAGFSLLIIFQRTSILRSPVLSAIPPLNQGGPFSAVHKSFAGSMALALTPTLFRIFKIRRRIAKLGLPSLADSFILQTHLLEAFLMGFAFFLFMIVCQLHAQVYEIAFLRTKLETLKKQAADRDAEYSSLHLKLNQGCRLDKQEEMDLHQKIDLLESTVLELKKEVENLQGEIQQKDEEISAAEANTKALQKQSEGFLLEYDRLLEDNQNLRSQLSLADRRLHHSDSNKRKS